MFDIGFSEILLIFGLALIVLGPEKLPRVASQVGRWIGRARGMARQFREQLEEEVNLEEARKSRPPAISQSAALTPPDPVAAPTEAIAQTPAEPAQPAYPDHYSHAHPTDAVAPEAVEPSAQSQQPQYPDGYSHAHPTDSQGRPLMAASSEAPVTESGQHDWVGVPNGDTPETPSDKPAQGTPSAGYAPPHERGT